MFGVSKSLIELVKGKEGLVMSLAMTLSDVLCKEDVKEKLNTVESFEGLYQVCSKYLNDVSLETFMEAFGEIIGQMTPLEVEDFQTYSAALKVSTNYITTK